MKPSRMIYVDARIELPVETAVLFGDDPTVETPAQAALMAAIPGADRMFPAGTVFVDGPALDIHLEGDDAALDLSMVLLELDGQLMRMMDDASAA